MGALRSVLSLAAHEFRITLRGRAGYGGILAACALAFAHSALKPHLPLVSGIQASSVAGSLILTPLAIIFVAGAARRDQAVAAGDVVGSRPYPPHVLLLARLTGNYAVVLLAYALVILSSLAAPVVFAGRWPALLTLVHPFLRGVAPLFYVVALAYCGVAVAGNALAAAMVAVYWLFVFLWGDFLARVFNFSLTQNWPTYVAIGLSVVTATMAWRRWAERLPATRLGRRLPVMAVALLVLGLLNAWHRVAAGHQRPLHAHPLALKMAGQYLDGGSRAPGFWLPDQHGRRFRMSSTEGRAVVIAFWSPHVPQSVPILEALQSITGEFVAQPVTCVAVCLADDHAISSHVAAEGRYTFPMVTDTGTHFSERLTECAPTAEAYYLGQLPALFVTDRGRRIVARFGSEAATDWRSAAAEVRRALDVRVPPS